MSWTDKVSGLIGSGLNAAAAANPTIDPWTRAQYGARAAQGIGDVTGFQPLKEASNFVTQATDTLSTFQRGFYGNGNPFMRTAGA
jgi:hypothetical protein